MKQESIETKILLVEDQSIIALVEKKQMESFGYQVVRVHSGEEALLLLQKDLSINLIIMDVELGRGMNGIETSKIIQQNYSIPIIFLSSFPKKQLQEQLKDVIFVRYLEKDCSLSMLQDAIESACF